MPIVISVTVVVSIILLTFCLYWFWGAILLNKPAAENAVANDWPELSAPDPQIMMSSLRGSGFGAFVDSGSEVTCWPQELFEDADIVIAEGIAHNQLSTQTEMPVRPPETSGDSVPWPDELFQ